MVAIINNCFRPSVVNGRYPQKKDAANTRMEDWASRFSGSVRHWATKRRFNLTHIVALVEQYQSGLDTESDPALDQRVVQLRNQLVRLGLKDELVAQSFALIREMSQRTLGKRHFNVQLLGGWIMINGMIAEMETGQGKTLTSTLASCTAALAGIPTHVITSNDYLAERDAEILKPLYDRLGVSSSAVIDGMETEERQAGYACDIVHTTNKQITFDYLRDRMEIGDDTGPLSFQFKQIQSEQSGSTGLLLRGLCFAIVDEADSVLIDEARTPLIISKVNQNAEQEETYKQALSLAESLNESNDFVLNIRDRDVTLTDQGEARLAELSQGLSGIWAGRRRRRTLVKQALSAIHFFHRDKQYIVNDDKVQIIDEHTGRVMADRSWEQGLHQMIETREGCTITGEREPLARISYQRFFRRYLRVAGMSGTVKEVADELTAVYGLRVVRVPTHQLSRRMALPEQIYLSSERKWQALTNKVRELNDTDRPILIGTCTVAESEYLSELLNQNGLQHCVLNARQDKDEADIIARAGQRGNITVATNMAGRGTDIQLGEGVEQLGGLHVIATERNSSRRVDRQLYGRCARQGDPGSTEAFLSIDDKNIAVYYSPAMLQLLASFIANDKSVPTWLGNIISSLPQKRIERQHRRVRGQMMKMDEQLARTLAFTGRLE